MSNLFQFGTSSTSGGSNAPTFGTAGTSPFSQPAPGKTTGGLFGNIGATPTTTAAAAAADPPSAPLFGGGSTTPTTGQTASLFGGQNSKSTFGNTLTKPSNPGQSVGHTPTTNLFGNASQTPKLGEPTSSGKPQSVLFGEQGKTTPATSGLFGSTTPAPSSGPSLFGNLSTTPAGPPPQTSAGQGLFTSQASTKANEPASLFGQKPTSSTSFPGFSATTSAVSPLNSPATTAEAPSFFTNTTQMPTPNSGNLFTSSPAKTQGAEAGKNPFFGNLAPTFYCIGYKHNDNGTRWWLFSSLSTPKTTAPKDSTTPATSSGQPASRMFNLAKTTTTTAPSTSSSEKISASGATTTAAATVTSAGATTATPATAGGLGASTVGPAPPAQSRLKNKTMDEILTRWATDLAKYQKEFQEQAEQVAKWDRMLVENGTKVQKLYGNTVDAERATQEVERQLASVEGQQDELSSWLDRYEQEVEALLSKQVGFTDSLQGPDQERERTYKLAERLSERLNEMAQDLTSMIEEVNSASSTLSKTTKADEPISQIVRILNSHLSQLQLIDQGTANLHAKIAASHKLGSSLSVHQNMGSYSQYRNGTGNGISGGDAAGDFYRAYMGREGKEGGGGGGTGRGEE
ncbi:predicted protein [Histoplasma mississippiense (nom. inval.)]|uniref:predicted protein n=1 Tax=Ajellomyces capsulatus (strain NAm1 / WU24) TaxID=2059318 RepID=UPI000157C188|nr:predicted protein [Histoplasma mississippiense (nom. inval.)]EDN08015.1 predicted protein [Histoplasma mississippiense (nom. inval.)]